MSSRGRQLLFLFFLIVMLIALAMTFMGCNGATGPDGDDAMVLDSIPPFIEWIIPTQDTTLTGSFDLLVKAGDDKGIWRLVFYVGGHDFESVLIDSTNGIYGFNWEVSLFPTAPYPVLARVWDDYRNRSSTQTILVNVERNQ